MQMTYGELDETFLKQLQTFESDADGPFYMLNLMRYRDEADYGPDGERGVTGEEADNRYAPLEILEEIGAAVCFFGVVEESSELWHRVAVVRYPTRAAFLEMERRPDFQERHVHKAAGMDFTIIVATNPLDALPSKAQRLLVELWTDEAATAATAGGCDFAVEGTLIGDRRRWVRSRFTSVSDDAALPDGSPEHQTLLVRSLLDRWR